MLLYVHCVAYLCAGVVLGWKPELSSKCRPILATQETLTDFQGVDAFLSFFFEKKKIQNGRLKKFRDWSLGE